MEISTPHPGPLPVRGGEGGGAHDHLVLRAVAEEDVVGEGLGAGAGWWHGREWVQEGVLMGP